MGAPHFNYKISCAFSFNMFTRKILFCLILLPACLPLIVQPEWKIYYDLRTNQTIDTTDTSNPRQALYRQMLKLLRIGFGPIPCSCQQLTCGCCAGMNIQAFDFNRRACMNFTYDPQEFAMDMAMLMDDEAILSQTVSAKNPPPFCVPAPIPPVLPRVDFCLRFFNIHTPGYNIFMCVDFETRMERAPLLVLHFDCMELGQDGISYHKPEEIDYINGGGDVPDIEQGDDEVIEEYDEVVEDRNVTQPMIMGSNGTRKESEAHELNMATTENVTPSSSSQLKVDS